MFIFLLSSYWNYFCSSKFHFLFINSIIILKMSSLSVLSCSLTFTAKIRHFFRISSLIKKFNRTASFQESRRCGTDSREHILLITTIFRSRVKRYPTGKQLVARWRATDANASSPLMGELRRDTEGPIPVRQW